MCSERRVLDGIFWNEMVEPKTKFQSFSDKKQVLMWQLGTQYDAIAQWESRPGLGYILIPQVKQDGV